MVIIRFDGTASDLSTRWHVQLNLMIEPIHPTGFALRVKNRGWPLRCRPSASPTPVFVVASKPKPHWQEIGFTSSQVAKSTSIGHIPANQSGFGLMALRLDQTGHRVNKSATSKGK